uniref:Pepsin-I3 domain-containing protein n=1 Tax=Heterorhabditis bacteriophora TaxID=37862 RepID=A0A1I7XPQ7_HETBA
MFMVGIFYAFSEPSVANPSDPEPVPTSVDDEEEREANVSPISPTIQDWTNQLKNDLGIGISESPRQQQQFAPVTVQSFAHAPAGVEFVTETAPVNLTDYQFGFVDPPTVADIPSNAPVASTESLFSTSRHTAAVAQKPMEMAMPVVLVSGYKVAAADQCATATSKVASENNEIFDNFLTIPFRLTQAALPALKKSGYISGENCLLNGGVSFRL